MYNFGAGASQEYVRWLSGVIQNGQVCLELSNPVFVRPYDFQKKGMFNMKSA